MKIATYNIASGGFTDYASVTDKPERLTILCNAVREINADILGLTDTFRWKEVFTDQKVQDTFGYPYSCHIDMDDTRVDKRIGVALLSKYPLISCEPIRLHNRNGLKAMIEKDEIIFDVIVVYLDDLSEATRILEVEALIGYITSGRPTIVMGDFNALWPSHVPIVKQSVEEFIQNSPGFTKRPDYNAIESVFENFYAAEALPALSRDGFNEPSQCLPTALTKLHPLVMPMAYFPVDHILVKNCSASEYQVHTGLLFEEASDHYPLSAPIKFVA